MKLYRISKFLITLALVVSIAFTTSPKAYAYTCSAVDDDSGPPGIEELVCPFARVINVLLFASGAVLILMILWGGFKLAMSLGDPKGFQAATSTWSHALAGFLIVVFALTILSILTRMLGWEFESPFQRIYDALLSFTAALGISVNP